jgi:hypothetical protein
MRRAIPLLASLAVLLAACEQAPARPLTRYYDPEGLFSARLPVANVHQVIAPEAADPEAVVRLLSGVSSAPQASDVPLNTGFATNQDASTFFIWALESDAFSTSEDVGRVLTDDPAMKVDLRRSFDFSDGEGGMLVGEYEIEGGSVGLAAGTLLFEGIGYVVIEVFPQGQWANQKPDFERVLSSFEVGAPLGVQTLARAQG